MSMISSRAFIVLKSLDFRSSFLIPSIRKPRFAVLEIVSLQTYGHLEIFVNLSSVMLVSIYHVTRLCDSFSDVFFLCRSVWVNLDHFFVHVLGKRIKKKKDVQ